MYSNNLLICGRIVCLLSKGFPTILTSMYCADNYSAHFFSHESSSVQGKALLKIAYSRS